ncbi:MAG: hypothetical protein GY758_06435, partial [Fuerstiella sp.]|nr:hypothetical protein [Fuerstiella sp.]
LLFFVMYMTYGAAAHNLPAERDELNTELASLREAFESARDELTVRQELQAKIEEQGEDQQQQLQQSLAERIAELQQTQTMLSVRDSDVAELQQKLREAVSDFEDERTEWLASAGSMTVVSNVDDTNQSVQAEYEEIIGQLRDQLQDALAASAATNSDEPSGDNTDSSAFIGLQQELAEKDELLLEMQAHLGGSAELHVDAEQIRLQHAELDDRIAVLDQREEESREQQRRIENTEEELESQRRQLLEARQQLELARAELQISADAEPQSLPDAFTAIPPDESTEAASTESIATEKDADRASIRSELADMFGLGGHEVETLSSVEELTPPAVDDCHVEASDEVSLSFSGVESVLLEATQEVSEETCDETAASDDFVADYMEQLLARNRQKAGGTLPDELAPESSSSASQGEAADKDRQIPQTRSFIDSYMAGEYDSQTSEPQAAVDPEAAGEPTAGTKDADADRPKIDLAALRDDMNSFRALSTQSIENALAVHAKRKERSGITARSTVFLVLAVICVFMISAVLTKVIPLGVVVWLSVAAVTVSGIELLAKICSVNGRVKRTADSLAPRGEMDASQDALPEQVISPELLEAAPLSARETSDVGELDEVEEVEEDEYFEL